MRLNGEIINEEDVQKHDKFNAAADKKSGFVTKSMLCVPMKDAAENTLVIGVIQLINKQGVIPVFDANDEQILTLLLSAASPIVGQFKVQHRGKMTPKKDDKFVNDLTQPEIDKDKRSSSITREFGALIEEEETEQDAFEDLKEEN